MTVMDRVIPEDAYYTAIGDAIQAARWSKGWTQLQLAERVGVESGACISYWESCVRRPSAYMVDRLEAVFGQRLRP